jgi:hypothetical protein
MCELFAKIYGVLAAAVKIATYDICVGKWTFVVQKMLKTE